MKIEVSAQIRKLAELSAFPIYVVGGYVRNQLANLPVSDIDLCGAASPEMLGLPKEYKIKVVNYRLGTALITNGSFSAEYTPFRVEKYAEGGCHSPVEVYFTDDIKLDAFRRDFTCNSIYYDIVNDNIIDFFNGVTDIENKLVRAYNPSKTFASDGLRLLRLVRIACELGFKLEGNTAKQAQSHGELLLDIAPERKREELDKILVCDTRYNLQFAHYRALRLLSQLDLWKYLIIEVASCKGIEQNPLYHKYDVLEHTFQTVKCIEPQLRMAALLHDIGKAFIFRRNGNMHGHERSSEIMARIILGEEGLRYSNKYVEEVASLCGLHMYDMNGLTSEGKLRVFLAQHWDKVDKLVALITADKTATGYEQDGAEHRFITIRNRMIEDKTPINLLDLCINGIDVIEAGFVGEEVGQILNQIHNECILNPKLNNSEYLTTRLANMYAKKAKVIDKK